MVPVEQDRLGRIDAATAELAQLFLAVFRPELSEGAPLGMRVRAGYSTAHQRYSHWLHSSHGALYRGKPAEVQPVPMPMPPPPAPPVRALRKVPPPQRAVVLPCPPAPPGQKLRGDPTIYRWTNGTAVVLARRIEMCRRYGIDDGAMTDLLHGKGRSAKGWRLAGASCGPAGEG